MYLYGYSQFKTKNSEQAYRRKYSLNSMVDGKDFISFCVRYFKSKFLLTGKNHH